MQLLVPSAKDDPFRLGETVYVARHVTTPHPPVAPSKLNDLSEQSEEYEKELTKYGKALLQYNKENFWLAKILQIRASAPEKVLILVAWLYWPYELPKGYQNPWFGDSEVFPSNLMDIIDASTVSDRAKIVYLDEEKDASLYEGVDATFQRELAAAREEQEKTGRKIQADDAPPILFWRQTFDSEAHRNNGKLQYADTTSKLRTFCVCHKPNNPDKKMFQCPNRSCNQWNHDDCLADDIGTRAFDNLGNGKIDQWAKDNSPKEAQTSLADRVGKGMKAVGGYIASEVGQIAGSGLEGVMQESTVNLQPVSPPNGDDADSPSIPLSASKKRGRPKKDGPVHSWKTTLTVRIVPEKDRPPFARIVEKKGEKRTWEVRVDCLACGETMD